MRALGAIAAAGRRAMRILIVALPRTGNSWLKCLLSSVYGLDWLTRERVPGSTTVEACAVWLAGPGFPD
jgi:hypothetical protein